MSTPTVIKKSEQGFQIEFAQTKQVKQFAILSLSNRKYAVEALLPKDTKVLQLKALGIDKQANTQYFLVAIGLQNQLSKMVAL